MINVIIALLVIFASIGIAFVGWYVIDFILILPKVKKLVADAEKPKVIDAPLNQAADAGMFYSNICGKCEKPIDLTKETAIHLHDRLVHASCLPEKSLRERSEPPKEPTASERLAEIRQRKAIIEGNTNQPTFESELDELRWLNQEEARITEETNTFA